MTVELTGIVLLILVGAAGAVSTWRASKRVQLARIKDDEESE